MTAIDDELVEFAEDALEENDRDALLSDAGASLGVVPRPHARQSLPVGVEERVPQTAARQSEAPTFEPLRSIAFSMTSFDVNIEKIVAGGDGLARYEGRVVFVPKTAPGERHRVEIVQEKKDYLRVESVACPRVVPVPPRGPLSVLRALRRLLADAPRSRGAARGEEEHSVGKLRVRSGGVETSDIPSL